jgi:uncharacterized membrane protein YqaE (UPF0057 family)
MSLLCLISFGVILILTVIHQVEFWICLLLTIFGYLPGIIYAIYIITK